MKMHVAITGMIAHGYSDIRYVHYGLDIFPTDSNHTIGSITRLLRDLEEEPKNSSHTLFSVKDGQTSLSQAMLEGVGICFDSLLPPLEEHHSAKPLLPILSLQLDNALGDNKNHWIFSFCSLLVFKSIFCKIYVNFLIVGHS